MRGALPDGRIVSVSGTVPRGPPATAARSSTGVGRLRRSNSTPTAYLLFFRYADRPGVVGAIGTILGEAGVNIAAMQVARREAGGEALMTLTVDTSVDPELLALAAEAVGATATAAVDLTD